MVRNLSIIFFTVVIACSSFSFAYADTDTYINENEQLSSGIDKDGQPEAETINIAVHIGAEIKADSDITNGVWESDNSEVATVSKDGTVKGIKAGTCIVTNTDTENPENVKTYCVTVHKRLYNRDSRYYSIEQEIKLPSGSYSISKKNIGLKVIYVNRKLLGVSQAKYTNETYYAVKKFQKRYGLKPTGYVNLKTWRAMGYSKWSWDNLGVYVTPIKINGGSKKSDYINAMLDTAREYVEAGTSYRIGCSGKPGTYVDCSGLVYQCLYSAGINPKTNIVDHALAKYEYASKWLAKDQKLGKVVSYSNKKKGDLIFYGEPVYHVAIYAGNGYVYDSWPIVGASKRKFNRPVSKVIRVFW